MIQVLFKLTEEKYSDKDRRIRLLKLPTTTTAPPQLLSSPLPLAPEPECRAPRQGRGGKEHRRRARAGAPGLSQEREGRS